MMSTPSIFLPVTMSKKPWVEIFDEMDQWEDVGKFYKLHSRELNTVQGHRRLCSPKVGHLLALRTGAVQLVHHIHQEDVDNFHGNDEEGKIWALMGAGGTASTIVIGTHNAYDRLSGKPDNWTTMSKWKTKADVTVSTDKVRAIETKSGKKAAAAAKRSKTPSGSGKMRRSVVAMMPKMKEYKKSLTANSDDDVVEVVDANDENADPIGTQGKRTGAIIPNILPVPAFIVMALMKAYSSDAATLCIAAIEVIKARAIEAGEDPLHSQKAKNAAYVVCWLWNVARDRTDRPQGVRIGSVANPRADKWSRNCHLRYLAEQVAAAASSGPVTNEPNSEVWTNLANALALQATERATGAATPATKKGFDAFPVAT